MQSPVLASEIQQRVALGRVAGALHLAHQDEMVAAVVGGMAAAFEAGQGVVEDWDAPIPVLVAAVREAVHAAGGEQGGDGLLSDVEDVDGEELGLSQHRRAGA